jgi:hypothetical protein
MNGAPQGGFPQGGPPGDISGIGPRGGFLPGGPLASIFLVALFAVTLIILAIAFYRLYEKAGMSGAIGLLAVAPVVNLGVALYLAFAEWPLMAELAHVKLLAASAAPATAAPPSPLAAVAGSAEPAIPLT